MAFLVLLMATKALGESQLSPENVQPKNVQSEQEIPVSNGLVKKTPDAERTNHSIRASKTISEEALRQYLEAKHSPLVPWAGSLGESPYWSTIIGICTIEEYSCSVNPHETNNLWGIMCSGHLCSYPSLAAGITAINDYLANRDAQGLDTVEKFRTQKIGDKYRAIYCYEANSADHICWGWERTVIRVKTELENL